MFCGGLPGKCMANAANQSIQNIFCLRRNFNSKFAVFYTNDKYILNAMGLSNNSIDNISCTSFKFKALTNAQ
jgi:hypothetical protein